MLTQVWHRHFNWLVTLVIIVGLAAGAALAGFTRPHAPAVVALPAGGQSSGFAFRGNSGPGGQGVAQAASDTSTSPVVGTVSAVDANTLTVRDQQGDVKVKLATAKVLKTADATAADLKSGERVTVMAQQEADGSYTATRVQIVPADQPNLVLQTGRGAAGGGSGAQGSGTSGGQGGSRAQRNGGAGNQGGSRAQGGQGQAQQDGGSRLRPIVGTISAVDGTVLTVSGQQGDTKVNLGSARIEKTVAGSAKDLQTDQRVMVIGQPGADGSYDSAEVEILPTLTAQSTASSGSRQ